MIERDEPPDDSTDAADWLGGLYDQHGARAYSLALAILHDRVEADAVVERAFLAVARRGDGSRDLEAAAASLLEGVRRQALGILGRRGPGAEQPDADANLSQSQPRTRATRWSVAGADAVRRARSALPDDQRTALDLVRREGLTRGAIADRMGLDVAEVTRLLGGAMRTLRTSLTDAIARDQFAASPVARPALPTVAGALAAWRAAERAVAGISSGGLAQAAAADDRDRRRDEYHRAVERAAAAMAPRVTMDRGAVPANAAGRTHLPAADPPYPHAAHQVVRTWLAREEHRAPASLDEVIVITDNDRRYVAVTANVVTLLGYHAAEVLGRRVDDLAAPELVAETPTRWDRFIDATRDALTFGLVAKDGSVVRVSYEARADFPVAGFHLSRLRPMSTSAQLD